MNIDLLQMVIKFMSTAVEPPVLLYMGVDKVENEDLIKLVHSSNDIGEYSSRFIRVKR